MPELPEVEVVRQGLEACLLKRRIETVDIYYPRVVVPMGEPWAVGLSGQRLEHVERRAKYLILRLERDCLLIHLRMTGQMLVQPPQARPVVLPFTYYRRDALSLPDRHTHFAVRFEGGMQLYFRDMRKFGRIERLLPEQLGSHTGLVKLGVEPLGADYTRAHFQQLLRGQRAIKAFLLDQTRIAGLGNIYADEALFAAGILPTRPVTSLRPDEIERLFVAIPDVLRQAVTNGGTTLKDYLHPDGHGGEHREALQVYGRAKQPCLRCGEPLQKSVVAQRGTHFCVHCQH